jgi:hypothetical protein
VGNSLLSFFLWNYTRIPDASCTQAARHQWLPSAGEVPFSTSFKWKTRTHRQRKQGFCQSLPYPFIREPELAKVLSPHGRGNRRRLTVGDIEVKKKKMKRRIT